MSYNKFLASNKPFNKLENPHITFYSIKEAKQLGIKDPFLESVHSNHDQDRPYIMIVDKEENLDEPEIIPVDEREVGYIEETLKAYSKKNYFSQIDFHYTKKRANKIIKYIKEHLNECDEVELWKTWFDNYDQATIINKKIEDISTEDIKEYANMDILSPYCIVIKNK